MNTTRGHGTKNGDLLEEALVHLSLLDCGSHQDPPVGDAVNSPQRHVGSGLERNTLEQRMVSLMEIFFSFSRLRRLGAGCTLTVAAL